MVSEERISKRKKLFSDFGTGKHEAIRGRLKHGQRGKAGGKKFFFLN